MQLQADISLWLSRMAELLPFGYAFGAGMVSAVNPCGFAMLPIYLSLYLGAGNAVFHNRSFGVRLIKAVWIAFMVTAGFGLLFGVVGSLVSAGGNILMNYTPWMAVFVGLLLLLLGIGLLFGKTFSLSILQNISSRIGDPREISARGFFLFGLAFGGASLSCTLPVFLLVVGSSLASGDFVLGLLHFISYILGMGSVILILTLGIALLKGSAVTGFFHRLLPWVQRVSALLLVVAGAYIMYYWLTSGLL